MSKKEFMEELVVLLGELPQEEKEEAIKYYESYFEEAGPEQEQVVLDELGSAGRIATQILRDYRAEQSAGMYTEHGYKEQETTSQTPVFYNGSEAKDSAGESMGNAGTGSNATNGTSGVYVTKKGLSGGALAVAIVVAVLTFPIWISILATAFGLLMGFFGITIGIVTGFGVGGISCIIGGVIAFAAGIVKTVTLPVVGVALIAIGLLVFGVGCLMIAAVGGVIRLAVWMVGGIIKWLGRLFHGKKGANV